LGKNTERCEKASQINNPNEQVHDEGREHWGKCLAAESSDCSEEDKGEKDKVRRKRGKSEGASVANEENEERERGGDRKKGMPDQ